MIDVRVKKTIFRYPAMPAMHRRDRILSVPGYLRWCRPCWHPLTAWQGIKLNTLYRPEGLIYIMGIFQGNHVSWWIPFSLASV